MATRVQWCLLWSAEDGMFEGAYSEDGRRRLRRIYQDAGVVICRACQSISNATISMFRGMCVFTCAFGLFRAGQPVQHCEGRERCTLVSNTAPLQRLRERERRRKGSK